MSQKPSLAEALKEHDRAPVATAQPPQRKAPASSAAPSRAGKKALITYHAPAVSRQLQQMKLDLERESVQDLVQEALNDLFKKYQKPPIA